ncbi:MAG: ATP-binding protein [Pseudolabrys sp.]|jgi:signal transduction histidine kinase
MRTLFLNRIGGQIAVLILLSLIAIHAFITASLYFTRHGEPFGPRQNPAELIAAIKLIAAAPLTERAHVVAQAAEAFPELHLSQAASPPAATQPAPNDRHLDFLARALGPAFRIAALSSGDNGALGLAVTLPDGASVTATLSPWPEPPLFAGPMAITILFIFVSVTLLGLWAARALRSPLSAFAQAAENFSLDDKAAANISPLPERGPEEIRAVARAFNRMRGRIKALVDDRTRLFAAMSHDLRTPITRLRLRSEFIADAELRGHMLRDLDQMNAMTESVLSFLRDGHAREAECAVDIASSLQTIADQFADMGHAARYEGPDHLTGTVRPREIHRAVVNLVDNAVRYGGETRIRLARDDRSLRIEVEDDGPGIPDGRKTAMLEPFARGDDARTMGERAGFGLGLSIARAIAEAHGGTLSLHDAVPRGLIARIALPTPTPL